jgi:hypothetical protein
MGVLIEGKPSNVNDPDYFENGTKEKIQQRYNKEIHRYIARNIVIQ